MPNVAKPGACQVQAWRILFERCDESSRSAISPLMSNHKAITNSAVFSQTSLLGREWIAQLVSASPANPVMTLLPSPFAIKLEVRTPCGIPLCVNSSLISGNLDTVRYIFLADKKTNGDRIPPVKIVVPMFPPKLAAPETSAHILEFSFFRSWASERPLR